MDLPIVSIAVDPDQMFNSVTGLYSLGLNAEDEAPYKGANFHSDRELESNVEYFDTSNIECFNQRAGVKIFGSYSRGFPQKSLALISREEYGNKDFNYPLFPDLKYKKYKSFILRNGGSDNNRTHFRDVFMTQLVKDLSFDIQSYRSCIVYINGKYWGIYHIREKLNEHFIEQHYKIDKDSVTIMKHRLDLKIGKQLNYYDILQFINKSDFTNQYSIDTLNTLIDINNYLEYNVCETYFANTDAGGNIRYWRSTSDTGKWRWIMFDTDFGFGLDGAAAYKRNSIEDFTKQSNEKWPYPAWSTFIIRALLENDSIREAYINKYCYFMGTVFDSTHVLHKINEHVSLLDNEIDYQHKRWGSNRSRWEKEIQRMYDFARYRQAYIYEYLALKFNLSKPVLVKLLRPVNGKLYFNNYELKENFSGHIFPEITQQIKVKPKKQFVFIGWDGINLKEATGSFKISSATEIKPILEKKKRSDLFGKVKFSEITMKRQQGMSDWLELYNPTDNVIDLTNWFLERDGLKVFSIPKGTMIQPNSYLVLTKESKVLDSLYDIKSIEGMFSLKDTSRLELYTSEGNMVDSIKLDYIGATHIELVNVWSEDYTNLDWEVLDELTPGTVNVGVKKQLAFNRLMNYYIVPGIALLIIISIIFSIILRMKRLRSSTE